MLTALLRPTLLVLAVVCAAGTAAWFWLGPPPPPPRVAAVTVAPAPPPPPPPVILAAPAPALPIPTPAPAVPPVAATAAPPATAPTVLAFPAPTSPAAALPAAAPPSTPPTTPGAPPTTAPTFDIVRVSPQGSAVVAGRAEPGADVTLFDGARVVARTRADRTGAFLALPDAPLAPGGRELTLASRTQAGAEQRSDGGVLVVVPAPPPPPETVASPSAVPSPPAPPAVAVAVLVPSGTAPRVLQSAPRAAAMALDVIDYDSAPAGPGAIRFTGAAPPGATVRVYVDGTPRGDAVAGPDGRWSLSPTGVVAPGLHGLRLDQIDAAGHVTARVELPFQRAAPPMASAAGAETPGRVVVQPGESLWRIAQTAYGVGTRYTEILVANRGQIRDPNLIYPGQAFTIPTH